MGPSSPRAVQLAFTAQPSSATAGAPINPEIMVAIEDADGNTVMDAANGVTLAIGTNPGGATLVGTASAAAVNGVATFPDLHINRTGAGYTLTASARGLAAATSVAFDITPGAAARLVFAVQPSNTMGGAAITPPVQVAAQDSFANLATGFRDSVTVTLDSNPASGALSGTTIVKAANGVATFNDLSIAQLSTGYTLRATAQGLGGVTSAPFAIAKPTASLHITTATTGSPPDPDGYAACIDAASQVGGGCAYGGPSRIGVNGTVTVAVDTGVHQVQLTSVAPNCTVSGDNPRAVYGQRGATIGVPFTIACAPPSLHVTTTTTGVSLDPDGYSVCVDSDYYYGCTYYSAIGLNASVTFPVTAGSHLVELDGVANNCIVSGDNPRGVDLSVTNDVSFAISCADTGSVQVAITASGTDQDQDGYRVCLDRSTNNCYWAASAPTSGVVTIAGVTAGPHTVTLTGVASNCTVSGTTAQAATVPPNGVVNVVFNVGCVLAERIAFSSSGTLTVIHADGSAAQPIAYGHAPAWSPDGVRLAYECGQDICVINADGTGFAQLTLTAAGNRHPSWSPDGLKIAFAAAPAGVPDLYVMAANGSGVVRLTQDAGFTGSPAWSPDGSKIAFDCQVEAGNDDLCAVNADGTGLARLTNDPGRDYGAAWKPGGSILAFATTRFGPDEIVLMSAAGGALTRLGAGLPGLEPTWSPDGTQLALVQVYQDYYYGAYDVIVVARADGSSADYIATGDQPAWKPHP
jgi:hypothetical protein